MWCTRDHFRFDNDPECIPRAVKDWDKYVGAKTAYIEPVKFLQNGYCQNFNARFRDEFLNREIVYDLLEAHILIEQLSLSGLC